MSGKKIFFSSNSPPPRTLWGGGGISSVKDFLNNINLRQSLIPNFVRREYGDKASLASCKKKKKKGDYVTSKAHPRYARGLLRGRETYKCYFVYKSRITIIVLLFFMDGLRLWSR